MFSGSQDNGGVRYTGEAWLYSSHGDGGAQVIDWNNPYRVVEHLDRRQCPSIHERRSARELHELFAPPFATGELVLFYNPMVGTPYNPAAPTQSTRGVWTTGCGSPTTSRRLRGVGNRSRAAPLRTTWVRRTGFASGVLVFSRNNRLNRRHDERSRLTGTTRARPDGAGRHASTTRAPRHFRFVRHRSPTSQPTLPMPIRSTSPTGVPATTSTSGTGTARHGSSAPDRLGTPTNEPPRTSTTRRSSSTPPTRT